MHELLQLNGLCTVVAMSSFMLCKADRTLAGGFLETFFFSV